MFCFPFFNYPKKLTTKHTSYVFELLNYKGRFLRLVDGNTFMHIV